jgi:HEAT repeat protein
MAKRSTWEDEVRALSAIDPRSADGRAALKAALGAKKSLVVAKAARIVKERALDGFEAELAAAFDRFASDGKKSDPSCHAKLAAIEALDFAAARDAEPFLRASRCTQHEGSDTAAGVRQRAVLALARLGHPDFELVAGRLAGDPVAPVRQAALEALAHRGERSGAGVAMLKLTLGDDDPLVVMAAMTTLVALAPDAALDELRARLDGDDDGVRELAAMALGQSKRDDALTVLLDALARCTSAAARAPLLTAIGLHRSERALSALLEVVADGNAADAEAALEALHVRRFEPGVGRRVREAAARNDRVELSPRAAELFAE